MVQATSISCAKKRVIKGFAASSLFEDILKHHPYTTSLQDSVSRPFGKLRKESKLRVPL